MVAAIRKAQAALPEFAEQLRMDARRILPALEVAVVKAFFPAPGTPAEGEHMFVDQVQIDGESVHGVLASEPSWIPGLKEGQEVRFPASRISDWFYVIRGRGHGGFTLDVLRKRMSADEYREAAEFPPFSWFAPPSQ